ncbi:hypothetical protein [Phytomonospora endophytica]|uniref:RHIM domain-containing protein n=1 Tax=Phytomonospora endophytica TaxID=714109 RepID=A0A841FCU5_9ACTN|nr:hypothetical protein [Phytomonospora endophytica]MBB6033235.1 hypothetical protein [Phytomonospora endophytica]
MTGGELIIAALVAGATAGTTDTVGNVIRDSYAALKGAVSRKLAERREVRDALEAEEVEPGVWRAVLDGSGIGEDEAVVALARRVLDAAGKYTVDLREAKGVQVGDGNTQHNTFS